MSRVAKRPVDLPAGVTATVAANTIKVKGAKGELTLVVADGVSVEQKEKTLVCAYASDASRMSAGAARAHLANMVTGVSKGYERKLELVGVGYRAAVQGKVLGLTLGFSHAVNFPIPDGISMETPTPDRNHHQGHRPSEDRSGVREDPRHSSPGAVQGQGRPLFR